MRSITLLLLLLLVACGGDSGNDPTGPGETRPEPPQPLEYSYFNRLPQPDNLSAVSEAGGRAIAVGNGGAVVIREPGETTWRRIQAPTRSALNAVHMIDAQTALAASFEGTWLSRDAGASWKLVDNTPNMREIAFRNGRAIVVGFSGIIFSQDLDTWEPAVDSPTNIDDVGFAGNDVIWAMSRSDMFRSTDGGKNWVRFITGSSFRAFAYAEENFGALGLGNFEVQNTTNGTTFTKVQDLPSMVADIDFKDSALGVLVTRNRHVYTSDSRGKAWTFRAQLDAEQLASDIELTSTGEVLIVGFEGLIAESEGGISSMVEISSGFGHDLNHVAFGTSAEGLAIQVSSTEKLFRTTNGGRNWEPLVAPDIFVRDVAFHSDEFALLLGSNGEVFRSDDLGETWVDTGASSESSMSCLHISDRDTWMAGGGGFISRTTNAGANWANIPIEGFVRAIDRFPGTDVVLGVGIDIIRSEDAGANWSGPVPTIASGNDVACLDENTAVVVKSTIYRTTDQGLTWENVLDLDEDLLSVDFFDELHGVAVGDDGTLVETIDGGQTWIEIEITGEPLLDVSVRGPLGAGVLIVGEDGVVIDGSHPLQ